MNINFKKIQLSIDQEARAQFMWLPDGNKIRYKLKKFIISLLK